MKNQIEGLLERGAALDGMLVRGEITLDCYVSASDRLELWLNLERTFEEPQPV